MSYYLKPHNVVVLILMTFALFVGAGNIILPPMIGLQAGNNVWIASFGFLITSVIFPILAIIALAKAEGNINNLVAPVGKIGGMVLISICYLTVGFLFATPRTAIVSFEVGIQPLFNDKFLSLSTYIICYFSIVNIISLYPKKLLNTVGYFLAPLKTVFISVLAISAIIWPAGSIDSAINIYKNSAFSNGFINGYLTMDTLGAMMFGVVIINTLRSFGIKNTNILIKYIILAGSIAGLFMIFLYLALFYLGHNSAILVTQKSSGTAILHCYVRYVFGNIGCLLLAIMIFLTCLVTAVGLNCACAEFFAQCLPISYNKLLFIFCGADILISNLGLDYLTKISIPILLVIYPSYIMLIILSFTSSLWHNSSRVIIPVVLTGSIFGIIDGIEMSSYKELLPSWIKILPLSESGITWIIPSIIILLIMIILDRKFL